MFPQGIVATTHGPDMVLWSPTAKLAYVVELTVLWEEGVEEAFERKKNRYSGNRSISEWPEDHIPSRSGMQGICCNIYHQSTEQNGGEGLLPSTNHQDPIKGSGEKQQLALDQV